eukprot:gnl/Spiro4/3308_TR1612_c1_g5_i1.p1 gnl/Spiro4/3308_TR1612_c1_g5~~gnl/Spiro4/3308_TR1612_c1_g5_i1.p1  ORF type:complete len:667 (-),score=195.96 gnl/Spiro4/3308_TR1612_c1_g5_i1:54-1973(-)
MTGGYNCCLTFLMRSGKPTAHLSPERYLESFRTLGTSTDQASFDGLLGSLRNAPLKVGCYHVFREGIPPIREHEQNSGGGKFLVSFHCSAAASAAAATTTATPATASATAAANPALDISRVVWSVWDLLLRSLAGLSPAHILPGGVNGMTLRVCTSPQRNSVTVWLSGADAELHVGEFLRDFFKKELPEEIEARQDFVLHSTKLEQAAQLSARNAPSSPVHTPASPRSALKSSPAANPRRRSSGTRQVYLPVGRAQELREQAAAAAAAAASPARQQQAPPTSSTPASTPPTTAAASSPRPAGSKTLVAAPTTPRGKKKANQKHHTTTVLSSSAPSPSVPPLFLHHPCSPPPPQAVWSPAAPASAGSGSARSQYWVIRAQPATTSATATSATCGASTSSAASPLSSRSALNILAAPFEPAGLAAPLALASGSQSARTNRKKKDKKERGAMAKPAADASSAARPTAAPATTASAAATTATDVAHTPHTPKSSPSSKFVYRRKSESPTTSAPPAPDLRDAVAGQAPRAAPAHPSSPMPTAAAATASAPSAAPYNVIVRGSNDTREVLLVRRRDNLWGLPGSADSESKQVGVIRLCEHVEKTHEPAAAAPHPEHVAAFFNLRSLPPVAAEHAAALALLTSASS